MNKILLLIRFATRRTLAAHLNADDSAISFSKLDPANSLIVRTFLRCPRFIAMLEILSSAFPAKQIIGTESDFEKIIQDDILLGNFTF